MFLSDYRNSRKNIELPRVEEGLAPIWQPYYTAAREMDEAFGTLVRNYTHINSGKGIGRLLAFVTRAGVYELIENLHRLSQFCDWRLQKYRKYHTQVAAQLDRRIREFESEVRALDQQHDVRFLVYSDYSQLFENTLPILYRPKPELYDRLVYCMEFPSEDNLSIKLISDKRFDHACNVGHRDQVLQVLVTHGNEFTEADIKLTDRYCQWLSGQEFQLSPEIFTSRGDYYEGVSFGQLVEPTLEALKANFGDEYKPFDEARDGLWCATFDHYDVALENAQQSLGRSPISVAVQIRCIKALLNSWTLCEDCHRLLDHAKSIARYCFPMVWKPDFFDFDKVCHGRAVSDFSFVIRHPDDSPVVMTANRKPRGDFEVSIGFQTGGTVVKCHFDNCYQLLETHADCRGNSQSEDAIVQAIDSFCASNDYYGFGMVRAATPLKEQLLELERLGLRVKFPLHPLGEVVYHGFLVEDPETQIYYRSGGPQCLCS